MNFPFIAAHVMRWIFYKYTRFCLHGRTANASNLIWNVSNCDRAKKPICSTSTCGVSQTEQQRRNRATPSHRNRAPAQNPEAVTNCRRKCRMQNYTLKSMQVPSPDLKCKCTIEATTVIAQSSSFLHLHSQALHYYFSVIFEHGKNVCTAEL